VLHYFNELAAHGDWVVRGRRLLLLERILDLLSHLLQRFAFILQPVRGMIHPLFSLIFGDESTLVPQTQHALFQSNDLLSIVAVLHLLAFEGRFDIFVHSIHQVFGDVLVVEVFNFALKVFELHTAFVADVSLFLRGDHVFANCR